VKRIGFTGTSRGMTEPQRKTVAELLEPGAEFHHGDCVGADAQAAAIARSFGCKLHCHPPEKMQARAFVHSDVVAPPKPFLERNHDIVDASELMIATPNTVVEVLRSGTWATIRYARRKQTPLLIVWPDGEVTKERA
jgi:hypothetical protein